MIPKFRKFPGFRKGHGASQSSLSSETNQVIEDWLFGIHGALSKSEQPAQKELGK